MEQGIAQQTLMKKLGNLKASDLMCFDTDMMMPIAAMLTLDTPLVVHPKKGQGLEKVRVHDTALCGSWQLRDNATKTRLYAEGVLRGDALDPDYLALVTNTMDGWRGNGKEALLRR
jgi:hypothetical protein